MTHLHFLCGSTGAGKTTYGLKLADDIGAVRFSIDVWMQALYAPDVPDPIDPAWMMERLGRAQALLWNTAAEVATRGTACILEMGFNQAATRRKYAGLAQDAGLTVRLHYLDVPAEERWRRVERRNANPGRELSMTITRPMFDYVEKMWEPPDPAELAALNAVRVA